MAPTSTAYSNHRRYLEFSGGRTIDLGLKYGDAVVKTYLIKAVTALGLLSVLAVAGVAASVAEPSYHGYPLHDWYTTDGY